jgi:hypothetical protein
VIGVLAELFKFMSQLVQDHAKRLQPLGAELFYFTIATLGAQLHPNNKEGRKPFFY